MREFYINDVLITHPHDVAYADLTRPGWGRAGSYVPIPALANALLGTQKIGQDIPAVFENFLPSPVTVWWYYGRYDVWDRPWESDRMRADRLTRTLKELHSYLNNADLITLIDKALTYGERPAAK